MPSARLLVIDDDESLRRVLLRVLSQAGYEVAEAPNGKEGIRLLKDQPFDLVIVDILMPEQDGFETIQELREIHPETKIIAISGAPRFRSYAPLEAAGIFGAHRTIPKPFEPSALLDVVRQLLSEN